MRGWRMVGCCIDRHNAIHFGEQFPNLSFETFAANVVANKRLLSKDEEAKRVRPPARPIPESPTAHADGARSA